MSSSFRWVLPLLLVVAVAVAAMAWVHWPLPLLLRSGVVRGAFHGSQVWCFQHMADQLSGEQAWSATTSLIGYPNQMRAPTVGWVPALLVAPLQALLGPVGAYNAAVLLSPALCAAITWLFLRRALRAEPWPAAAGALAYSLSPYMLGIVANGQIEKVQAWILPLYLWLLLAVIRGRRPWLALPGLALVTAASALTSPSIAMLIPMAAVVWALGALQGDRHARGSRLAWILVALAATAEVLLLVSMYYGDLRAQGVLSAFQPASFQATDAQPYPLNVAEPACVFLGACVLGKAESLTGNQVSYLGLSLLLASLVFSRERFRFRGVAWACCAIGVVVSLGPVLVQGGEYLRLGQFPIPLPAMALQRLGYPLAYSGMYYRAILLASLGLAVLLACGTSRLRPPWGARIALALTALLVADGWFATRELWPRRVDPIAGHQLLLKMREDPQPGAVLDLPLGHSTYKGGLRLLAAVVHGRATTGLPQIVNISQCSPMADLHAELEELFALADPQAVHAELSRMGFRYVVRDLLLTRGTWTLDELERALGPPSLFLEPHQQASSLVPAVRVPYVWRVETGEPSGDPSLEPSPEPAPEPVPVEDDPIKRRRRPFRSGAKGRERG